MAQKKYLIAYIREFEDADKPATEEYEVFIENSSQANYNNAKARYDELVSEVSMASGESLYSCNLCEIIESTDY